MTMKKEELENTVRKMLRSGQDLSCNVEEHSDRILALERQIRETETQVQDNPV